MPDAIAPIETIAADKVARAIAAITEAHAAELARLRASHASNLDRLISEVRVEARAEGVRAGAEAYKRGSFQIEALKADEHRDVTARIAEYRTRSLGVEITYNDPDGGYFVTATVRAKPYWEPRFRLEKVFATKDEAVTFFDRIVFKFGDVVGFATQVDY